MQYGTEYLPTPYCLSSPPSTDTQTATVTESTLNTYRKTLPAEQDNVGRYQTHPAAYYYAVASQLRRRLFLFPVNKKHISGCGCRLGNGGYPLRGAIRKPRALSFFYCVFFFLGIPQQFTICRPHSWNVGAPGASSNKTDACLLGTGTVSTADRRRQPARVYYLLLTTDAEAVCLCNFRDFIDDNDEASKGRHAQAKEIFVEGRLGATLLHYSTTGKTDDNQQATQDKKLSCRAYTT